MIINWKENSRISDIEVVEPEPTPRCEKCGSTTSTEERDVIVKKRQGTGSERYKTSKMMLCDRCYGQSHKCIECGGVSPNEDAVFAVAVSAGNRRAEDKVVYICGACAYTKLSDEDNGTKVMYDHVCGRLFTGASMTHFKGKKLGKDSCCEMPGQLPDGLFSDGFFTCRTCATRIKECSSCGEYTAHITPLHCRVNKEDKHPSTVTMCATCVQNSAPVTHEYNYIPEMRFHSHKTTEAIPAPGGVTLMQDPFFGVELEMDCGGKGKEFTKWASKALGYTFYLKRDGSLSSLGVEAVSFPATLESHMSKMGWNELLERAKACGYVSWNSARDCGLHVHISRWSFDPNQRASNRPGDNSVPALGVLSSFYGENFRQIAVMSGRENEQYSKIRPFADGIDPTEISISADHRHGGDRYWAVNYTNKFTIELRHFRGSMRHDTIMMAIAYSHAVAAFTVATAKNRGGAIDGPVSWDTFCRFINSTSVRYTPYELLSYELNRRGLWNLTEEDNIRWLKKHGRRSLTDIVYESSLEHREVTTSEIDSNIA